MSVTGTRGLALARYLRFIDLDAKVNSHLLTFSLAPAFVFAEALIFLSGPPSGADVAIGAE